MDAITGLKERISLLVARIAATAERNDRAGEIERSQLDDIAASGLLALTIPQSQGGLGAGAEATAEVLRQIGRADPSVALVLSMHFIQHLLLARNANYPAHLRAKLIEDALNGRGLVNMLRVEPKQGTPARGGLPETVARLTPEGWRLTGHKIYSTGSTLLDWYQVWLRTDEGEAVAPRVGMILVPAGLPGTRIERTWDHLGLRASGSHDVIFDDVLVPLDHAVDLRLPQEWGKPDPLQASLFPVLISAIYDGVAQASLGWIAQFLHDRVPSNLGAPLATLPRMQEAVGKINALLIVNNRLLRSFLADVDANNGADPVEAGVLKMTITNNAVAAVEEALSLSGNHGLSRSNPLERHYRDVLCGRVHTPQDDSVRTVAGRAALHI